MWICVRHDQQRFQVPQRAVLAPFFCQFDRGLRQVPGMFLQLSFESLEQRKRVRRRARKPRQDLSLNRRRVFRAVCFMTWSPMVTWPSAMSTTLLSLRTHSTVVPCICGSPAAFRILQVYRDPAFGSWRRRSAAPSGRHLGFLVAADTYPTKASPQAKRTTLNVRSGSSNSEEFRGTKAPYTLTAPARFAPYNCCN